eukprot:COSAG02_NODE_10315_length_1970_cov_1.954035_2_plen_242_part_00
MPQDNQFSHASPFARILESGECTVLCQLGCRTVNPHQRAQRKRYGVLSLDAPYWPDTRAQLWIWLDAALPKQCLIYISIDTDALDPAFAPVCMHPAVVHLQVLCARASNTPFYRIHVEHLSVSSQGVSHYEPGGLSVRQILDVIHALHPAPANDRSVEDHGIPRPEWLHTERHVIGADVVEYNVERDIGGSISGVAGPLVGGQHGNETEPGVTAMVGAKLLKELAALLHRSRSKMNGPQCA